MYNALLKTRISHVSSVGAWRSFFLTRTKSFHDLNTLLALERVRNAEQTRSREYDRVRNSLLIYIYISVVNIPLYVHGRELCSSPVKHLGPDDDDYCYSSTSHVIFSNMTST